MKKLRVLVLMHESLVPPAALTGYTPQQIEEWKTEYDVMAFLREAGHEVRALGLYDNLAELRQEISSWKPDITFNLLQEFQGIVTYDQHIVAFLELMRQPYTGCNPRGMMLSRDKVLTKQLMAWHRIPTPQFALFRRGRPYRLSAKLRYPLFVKSATEDASLGISQASIVEDRVRLRERIDFIHESTKTDALVEEYIEGRELYVGLCGNDRLRTFPVWEMNFGTLPKLMSGIATRRVKWNLKYQQKHGIETGRAAGLSEATEENLSRLSKRIYRALHMTGYARMDFRMRADGSIFLLEANCNPNLSNGEDFAARCCGSRHQLWQPARKAGPPRPGLPGGMAEHGRARTDRGRSRLRLQPSARIAQLFASPCRNSRRVSVLVLNTPPSAVVVVWLLLSITPACFHAVVHGRDADRDIPGVEQGLQGEQHLLGETLLYLWALGEEGHDAIDLGKSDHLALRDVGHAGRAIDGDEVVFAGRGQIDAIDAHHFLHLHLVLDHGELREIGVVQAAEDLVDVHLGDAPRGVHEAVITQVEAQHLHDFREVGLDALALFLGTQLVVDHRGFQSPGDQCVADRDGLRPQRSAGATFDAAHRGERVYGRAHGCGSPCS
jgi:D-alanine-D-alanine ligase